MSMHAAADGKAVSGAFRKVADENGFDAVADGLAQGFVLAQSSERFQQARVAGGMEKAQRGGIGWSGNLPIPW